MLAFPFALKSPWKPFQETTSFFWFIPRGATYLAAVPADMLTNVGATSFSPPCVTSDRIPLREQHRQEELIACLQVRGLTLALPRWEQSAARLGRTQPCHTCPVPPPSPHCYRIRKKAPMSVYPPRNHETSILQTRAVRAAAALQHFSIAMKWEGASLWLWKLLTLTPKKPWARVRQQQDVPGCPRPSGIPNLHEGQGVYLSVCRHSPPSLLWCWLHPVSHKFPQPFHPPALVMKLLDKAPSNNYLSNPKTHVGKKQGETAQKGAGLTQCARGERCTCKTFLTFRGGWRLPAQLGGI